ncbi:MAG: Asp-tRNA(Asn)/Glu-tRNA(Gln) amidotransferase subunit GatA [Deltaproteobacteria bacterium]|nr:Asp-tRNA(Asn)/Glu-tRNA(Gln) amidotransferase subunit GatA [Deltaproteobacteria bacterium]
MDLSNLTIHQINDLLKYREVKSVDITNSYIKRIKEVDPVVSAYLYNDFEEALSNAADADKIIQKNKDFPYLTGIPLSIKDIFLIKGKKTTCASKILDNFISPYDSTVIRRLKENNYVFLGKTNMDEFAMGSSTENSAYKITKNPYDLNRVPGGSSGGSAASVSSDLCAGSFGTDTGGSVRQPASLCGVVGLKPTYGLISRYGIIAFSSSLDQAGVIANDVLDAAIMLKAVAGFDEKDQTTRKFEIKDYPEIVKKADKSAMKGLKVGIPVEFFSEGLDPKICSRIMEIKELLKDLGADIVDISLPDTKYSVAAYYVIATSEASSNLERYDGIRFGSRFSKDEGVQTLDELYRKTRELGFGKEVKRRIILGTFALSAGYYDAYYKKASLVRKLIIKNYKDSFNDVDIILGPTSPTPAFLIGEKMSDPLSMYLSDIYTISVNLAYLPALSLPVGVIDNPTKKGGVLPVGLQLISPWATEARLLSVAKIIEDEVKFRQKYSAKI